ncbi:3-phosphoshikimate 1-carboxyvinyltransferase [Litorilinea aerophila]|uniref:3-phosphoshikimate 1-carboxyvinyltransferase n=1 Tax=Litorilinea aerophila TaxID=1204385 RepID=A0A540VC54_9CHLR|nr:3-phosphoshikimate 1-carboxyvinyltransferase [Litorilinea aerophila]MCC9077920.1 3-phosphoshikimate 1-carboxyvinyltransferase [Litorilinea aerophila]OUC04937.1 3-phosphoshikimate 1-carboxyvinyltransferase [Litorilinea aerophila]GIV78275.1 MAG: 3-phosphoshikimate 1-carboxyvinyltransferase [Litorilinea sp.]
MTQIHIHGGHRLTGRCHVPGDKSISHRAVMFASIAEGVSKISNFLDGGDCRSTVAVMRGLGVQIDEVAPTELVVHGRGLDGLQEPEDVLDCGNSGTTIRLLTGLLAGQPFSSFLNGTAQIRRRPMDRIVQPLRRMGATIMGRQDGRYAPLGIAPGRLRAFEYDMPVASAQVKSCLLLAGLYAQGLTVIRQPGPARDHTERMLQAMGAPIAVYGNTVHSERPSSPLQPLELTVPGDISSAAFLLAAASIVPDSRITITGVGVNPTRTGFVEALQEMGVRIEFQNPREQSGEPVADLEVQYGELRGATFGGQQIVTMIDELPTLAVVATQAHGRTVVKDAGELRVKETDRIATTVSELRKMGARIEPTPDGFIIDGPTRLMGGTVESHGDHRLAMAMTVAALAAQGPTTVYGAEVTADSFPGFEATLQALGAALEVKP